MLRMMVLVALLAVPAWGQDIFGWAESPKPSVEQDDEVRPEQYSIAYSVGPRNPIMAEPKIDAEIVGRLARRGQPVLVIGADADARWAKINTGKVKGWVLAPLLTFDEEDVADVLAPPRSTVEWKPDEPKKRSRWSVFREALGLGLMGFAAGYQSGNAYRYQGQSYQPLGNGLYYRPTGPDVYTIVEPMTGTVRTVTMTGNIITVQ